MSDNDGHLNDAKLNDENPQAPTPVSQGRFKPLRTWPAVGLVAAMLVMVIGRFVPAVMDGGSLILFMITMMGPLLLGGLVLIWWLAFSRATIKERLFGFFGAILVAIVAIMIADKSILGPAIMLITIPLGTAAFACGAFLFRSQLSFKRTFVAVLMAGCGFGFTALLRSEGMWSDGSLDLLWRWQPTSEEKLLAQLDNNSTNIKSEISAGEFDAWLATPEWPRFRGADGLSRQVGPKVATDWVAQPPKKLWDISVGPGWSSFSVAGNLLFTQEQRGENEAVVCYAADTGAEIWTQEIESRFYESIGGPGPRATPTLADGKMFVLGATGELQRLNPRTGEQVWVKDIREVADREPPVWGFSSSPLVVGSVVIVHAGGKGDKGTLAFDMDSGELKWSASAGDHSYSSPQLCTIGENEFVVMLTNAGVNILDPKTGQEQLGYEWPYSGYRSLQPPVIDGDSILVPSPTGTRRIRIENNDGELSAEELWTSNDLKPDFNDFVVHDGHAYGFNGAIFTCIDLETGKKKWRGGRYGKGQVLLLANSGLLLVASEKGEAILLKADPGGHQELSKMKVFDDKTWNHPVVVGDRLYIRNAEQAACFQLPLAETAN